MDVDEGLRINKRAALLQQMAAEGSSGSEALSALTNALGNEAAAVVMRHPNVQNSSAQHLSKLLDGMLEIITAQLREFAYITATGTSPGGIPSDNPWRALNPEGFHKGEKINRRADELRRVATRDLGESESVTSLQTALGSEVAAQIARRNPHFSPDQKLYTIDQVLDEVCPGVRDAAYRAADLPEPQRHEDGKELTEHEFRDLTNRIINAATKNNMPVGDALAATAKAVGLIICILSEDRGANAEELVKFSQNAVAEFTREAISFRHKS
jgi:hypothetical protein